MSKLYLTRTVFVLGKSGGNVTCVGHPSDVMPAVPVTAAKNTVPAATVSLEKTNVKTYTTAKFLNLKETKTVVLTAQTTTGLFMLIFGKY